MEGSRRAVAPHSHAAAGSQEEARHKPEGSQEEVHGRSGLRSEDLPAVAPNGEPHEEVAPGSSQGHGHSPVAGSQPAARRRQMLPEALRRQRQLEADRSRPQVEGSLQQQVAVSARSQQGAGALGSDGSVLRTDRGREQAVVGVPRGSRVPGCRMPAELVGCRTGEVHRSEGPWEVRRMVHCVGRLRGHCTPVGHTQGRTKKPEEDTWR